MNRIFLLSLFFIASLLVHVPVSAAGSPFKVRAFHLDMRTEVMTPEALEGLVEHLADRGINTLIMEWEATFPFDSNAVICNRNAYTEEEVTSFISYCNSLGIDVIPLQHCFGHCEYILRHDRYGALREDAKDPSQVCPLKIDEAVGVFSGIFSEVASLHTSRYFHIGADETYLLGDCPECSKAVEKYGKSKLFVDYVSAMCGIVERMGKIPVMWADIILQHPEALDELPDNLVFVDWNYGWSPDRFGRLDNLLDRGVRMWGAGALRSGPDNWYLTQWKKHFDNIADFVPFAREHGYEGMVQTSWSTSGTYGYYFDSGNEILDMQPIRLVYPMSAFVIMEDAFCQAVASDGPFVPEDFIREYATEEMGLDEAGAEVLAGYFSMPQEQITVSAKGAFDTSGRSAEELLEECSRIRGLMAGLKPRMKKDELAHWILMLDMRMNYLRFKAAEAEYQSPEYDRTHAAGLSAELKAILSEEDALARRFSRLNRGYLKESEIEYINYIKSLKINILYNNVTNSIR